MSLFFSGEAIVLKVGHFKEYDCWVRFLTPGKGVVTGFAFGGCRSRRRFAGCLEAFSHVRFTGCYQKRGYLTLEEGQLLDRFPKIHQQAGRMGIAVNCLKFLEAVQVGDVGSGTLFLLLVSLLKFLNEQQQVPQLLPVLFRAKLAAEYGYCPDLQTCTRCSRSFEQDEHICFSLEQGQVFCSRCGTRPGMFVLTGRTARKLSAFLSAAPDQWLRTDLVWDCDHDLLACLDHFALYHLGLIWDRGSFRQAS